MDLKTLVQHFEKAGVRVVVLDGAEHRGRPGAFNPTGVLNHHTGASMKGKSLAAELAYAKWMTFEGRPDLPAPLVQFALGRSCTLYICALGRSNHGGDAKPSGSVAGGNANTLYYGIEWMLSGTEEIPEDMMQTGITVNAVITELVTKTSVQTISCHYQTSVTGKWDIGDPHGIDYKGHKVLDVDLFRREVQERRIDLYHSKTSEPNVPAKAVPLVVGTYNTRLGFALDDGDLGWLLRNFPFLAIIALQEAHSAKQVAQALRKISLRERAKWRILSPKDTRPGMPTLLVRRWRFKVVRWSAPTMKSRFARARLAAVLYDRQTKRNVYTASIHVDPLGQGFEKSDPRARAVHIEQMRKVTDWFAAASKNKTGVLIGQGDFNESLGESIQDSASSLGRRTTTQLFERKADMLPAHALTPRGNKQVHLDDAFFRDDKFIQLTNRRVVKTPSPRGDHEAVVTKYLVNPLEK